ncbi:MAG: OmpA family protein [Candidatus Kapabacteria bacterium]|nr:OmpA family protein [Candidatus Kapabacteria bacterium]
MFSHLRNEKHSTRSAASLRSLCVLCCAVIAFSFSFSCPAQAQLQQREPVLWRAGVFGNYGLNFHQALFDSLSGLVNSSPPFTGGRGTGFTLGALFEKPLSHDFSLAGRVSVTRLDGSMNSREAFAQFEPVSAQLIEAELESRFTASLTTFSLEPLVAWHPFPNASVYLGARIGYSIGNFTQDQRIVNDPTGLARLPNTNQTSSILTPSRDIPSIFIPQLSALTGISYAIPLDIDETIFLAPEAWYSYNFTPFVSNFPPNQTWTINSLRGGVSLRYSPEAARRYLPPAIVRTAETPRLAINITPLALDSSGAESPLLRLRMEETLSRQMRPLLPYIFFDKNNDVIPARYLRLLPAQTAVFSEKSLAKWGTLEIYYHALNLIGKRLRDNPSANIRIVGYSSADEQTTDSMHITLAARRAEAVMMYLRDLWRIPMERLQIETRALPAEPSPLAATTAFANIGHAENRRVEIYSDSWEIMRPITHSDTLIEATPPSVKFLLGAVTKGRISKWRFKIEQGRQLIQSFGGLGVPESELYWHPSREHRTVPRTEEAIRCNFDFLEDEGEGGTATISIPIEQVTIAKKRRKISLDGSSDAERSIETYQFINFSPAGSALTAEHKRMLEEITETRIDARAKVFVTGYTDKAGNAARNLVLSSDRANAVALNLTQTISAGNHVPTPLVAGRGGTLGIYSEATPEGRMYARMVEIRIEMPSSVR